MSSHWSQADEVFALSLALSRVPGRILVIEIKIGRVLRCVRLRTYSLLVPVGPERLGQFRDLAIGLLKGSEIGELAADMHVDPDRV